MIILKQIVCIKILVRQAILELLVKAYKILFQH